jgi:hypothetical protein
MATGKSGKKAGPAGTASAMSQNVRKMGSPVYNVMSGGVTIDWTDKISEAVGSFDEAATYPKVIYSIAGPKISVIRKMDWNSNNTK